MMANEIKRLLVEEDYLFILLDDVTQLTPTGEDKYIYIINNSNPIVAKKWDYLTKVWIDIVVNADDVIKVAKIGDLPIVAPTNKESLYLIEDMKALYQWVEDPDGSNGRFTLLSLAVSQQRAMVANRYVRYSGEPVPDYGLKLDTVYQAKNDNEGFYILDLLEINKKIRIAFDIFLMLFTDISGVDWISIFGSWIPISDKPQNYMEQIRDIKKLLEIFDKNLNGISDESENSRRLGGKSLEWIMAEISNVKPDLTPIQNQIDDINNVKLPSKLESIPMKNNNIAIGNAKEINFTKDLLVELDTNNPNLIHIGLPIDPSKFVEASNFQNTVGINGANIQYSWINSNANDYLKTVLFTSTVDITNMTYKECLDNSTGRILKVKESNVAGAGDNAVAPTTPLTKYYSKIFTIYLLNNKEYSSKGLTLALDTIDNTPPPSIGNLRIEQIGNTSAKLTWVNPTSPLFKGVSILRKVDNFPSDEHDGFEVYKGNDISFTDTTLEKGKNYFYKAFSYSMTNKYSSDVNAQVQFALDNTPPNPITNPIINKGYQLLRLKWTGSTSIDVKKTILLRKVGTVASSAPDDGSVILTVLARDNNAYQNTFYVDGGLQDAQTYTYTWFVYDNYDNISTSVSITGTTSTDLIPELSGFKATNLENGTKVKVEWTNPSVIPSGLTFLGREVYYTSNMLIDVNNMDRNACIADTTNLTKLTDGIGQGVGRPETFEISPNYGDMVQMKAFTKYNNGVNDIWSVGTVLIHIVKDDTPTGDITDLTYTGGDGQNTLNWKNPIDADFAKVSIYRKLGDYPTGDIISEKVHELTTQNLGNINTFIDTGLENNKTYYYLFVTEDAHGNLNKNTKVTVATVALQAYTIEYNLLTDTIERKDLSNGKTIVDLLATPIYSNIKRCVVKDDGIVNYYLDPTDSTKKENGHPAVLDGTDGQVMTEFGKKFYVKVAMKDATTLICSVSERDLAGYTIAPMFVSNGVTYEKAYIACFESYKNTTTNKFESRIGVLPTSNLDVPTIRTLSSARGNGWNNMNRHALDCIRILYMILYANGNSQTIIGKGIVNDTQIHQTGETLSLGNGSGHINVLDDGKQAMSLFGIENIWGNLYNFIDGLVITDTNAYVTDYNYSSFVSESSLGSYKPITGFNPFGGLSGFVSGLYFTTSYPTMFFANKFTGSDSTYTCDFTSNKQAGGFAYMFGGFKYDSDTMAGIFSTAYVKSDIASVNKDFTNIGQLEGSGSYQKVIFNKNTDGNFDGGIKTMTSLAIDDSSTIWKLNINTQMNNVCGRLMILK